MARRPLAFGVRFRHKGRTLRVRPQGTSGEGYVVEDGRDGRPTRRRDHATLSAALRDFAATWRGRLH
jgi:hypothetical protein